MMDRLTILPLWVPINFEGFSIATPHKFGVDLPSCPLRRRMHSWHHHFYIVGPNDSSIERISAWARPPHPHRPPPPHSRQGHRRRRLPRPRHDLTYHAWDYLCRPDP